MYEIWKTHILNVMQPCTSLHSIPQSNPNKAYPRLFYVTKLTMLAVSGSLVTLLCSSSSTRVY